MEDGGWRMEDGGWRMEDGGWERAFVDLAGGSTNLLRGWLRAIYGFFNCLTLRLGFKRNAARWLWRASWGRGLKCRCGRSAAAGISRASFRRFGGFGRTWNTMSFTRGGE